MFMMELIMNDVTWVDITAALLIEAGLENFQESTTMSCMQEQTHVCGKAHGRLTRMRT